MIRWVAVRPRCIVIEGYNFAEAHPVGFQWVMEAKAHGATIIHVDPRFTRTSAMADLDVPIRAGSDVAFLGGLIRHVLENDLAFMNYVRTFAAESRLVQAVRIERRSYRDGPAAPLLKTGRALAIAGGIVTISLGRRSPWASRLAGLALVAGSAATRFGVFEAGVASAGDPEQVVVPQRRRLAGETTG